MRAAGSGVREVLKGSSEQIVRVRVPVPGVFREAVFFLRRGGRSREELLRQARRAAESYLRPFRPERRGLSVPLLALCAAAGLALGLLIGAVVL